jgi:hypothetical protein
MLELYSMVTNYWLRILTQVHTTLSDHSGLEISHRFRETERIGNGNTVGLPILEVE